MKHDRAYWVAFGWLFGGFASFYLLTLLPCILLGVWGSEVADLSIEHVAIGALAFVVGALLGAEFIVGESYYTGYDIAGIPDPAVTEELRLDALEDRALLGKRMLLYGNVLGLVVVLCKGVFLVYVMIVFVCQAATLED